MGNLQIPESVQRPRTALHAKAKEESEFRFYLLYDKVYRRDHIAKPVEMGKLAAVIKHWLDEARIS